jgi:predicted dehydrogenase
MAPQQQTNKSVSIAVVGAGLIGRRHAAAVRAACDATRLHAIVDPAEAGRDLAASLDVPCYRSLEDFLSHSKPDGIILATPSQLHATGAQACITAGIATLVEKPITTDVASALALVTAAEKAGVPLLTGHHRRHNPLIHRARQAIDDGDIGSVVAVHVTTWFCKPDDYFTVDWRGAPGAGPVFLNLIHDIDLLHYLLGPVARVSAIESNAVRHHAVEDSAVIALHFASGTLGTMTVSDTVVAP